VCLLPLYPGLVAFLAGAAPALRRGRLALLGALVLLGVLTLMTVVAAALTLLRASFSGALPVLLPVVYGVVTILGVTMVVGLDPFARLGGARLPALRNPYLTAFVYGLLLGPMTLPCTGPVILSAFVLGFQDAGYLASGVLYFLVFGLGFGWPLVLIPVLAERWSRGFTALITRHHGLVTRASGALLLVIGIAGFAFEVLPNVA